MNRNLPKKNFRPASLRQDRSARTVLLRMAADQERADRIRALKLERPDLTWRRIADHVGVSERAASDWQKKGGIEYANAKKLAALFEVDTDYIWRGTPADETPDLSRQDLDTEERLARMEERLDDHARAVEQLIAQQNELLARQSRILERIEAAIAADDETASRLADADEEFVQRVAQLAAAAFEPAPRTQAREQRKPATSRTPRA